MCPVKYYTIMRQSKDPRWLRYEMVRYARDKGIKPAVTAFDTTPKTARKWLKRWQPGSLGAWKMKAKLPKARNLRSIRIKDKGLSI